MSKLNHEFSPASGVSAAQTLWDSLYAQGAVNSAELPESQDMPRDRKSVV